MRLQLVNFSDVGWCALGGGGLALVGGYSWESQVLWIVGSVAAAVGILAIAIALWRDEAVLASGARDDFEPTAGLESAEVPHAEAVAALGDRGEARPPR
jgi:hypothetical protein